MALIDLRNADYSPVVWQDQVVDSTTGTVLQAGTPVNQTNLNNDETGIMIAHYDIGLLLLSTAQTLNAIRQDMDKWQNQRLLQGQATITNSTPATYFNTADPFVNVSLSSTAYPEINAPNYDVQITPISADDLGRVGQLLVSNKAQNGFTVTMTGSATTCTFLWTIVNPSIQ